MDPSHDETERQEKAAAIRSKLINELDLSRCSHIDLPGLDATFLVVETMIPHLIPAVMRGAEPLTRAAGETTARNPEGLVRTMHVLGTIGNFMNGYIHSLPFNDDLSSEEVKSFSGLLWQSYEEICRAIIDYNIEPPEQHSPLAAFVGQFFVRPSSNMAVDGNELARPRNRGSRSGPSALDHLVPGEH